MIHVNSKNRNGFTLIEMISVVIITALVVIAILGVHYQITTAVASINQRLDGDGLSSEVLQRIAEDLDRLASPGFDTVVRVYNKFEGGYQKGQFVIENKIYDSNNKPKVFEKIVWHCHFDEFLQTMVLYRSHGGIAMEDTMLDYAMSSATETSQALLQQSGQEPCVPICDGLTYFEILAISGSNEAKSWSSEQLPTALKVSVSFAEPVETETGEFLVPFEEIHTRTIALNRTRKINYKFVKRELEDPNDISSSDPNDLSSDIIDPVDETEMPPETGSQNQDSKRSR